jgi:5,10-methylene-tetrahydrofolate dehydrogenase/methenyl tetrahydrofolate cyclohydrolase
MCIWNHPSVIIVNPLAESLRQHVREYTQSEKLKLVGILATQGLHRIDSEVFVENIQEICHQDNIQFDLWKCPSSSSSFSDDEDGDPSPERFHQIQELILQANHIDDVDGILIFYPMYQPRLLVKGPYKRSDHGGYTTKLMMIIFVI